MSDARKSSGQKRKKSYYIKSAQGKKARRRYDLAEGMKGFLITCNRQERQAVREAYNIFNEFAERLWGPEKTKENESDESNDDEVEDFELSVRKEVSALKNPTTERRFQVVESGAKNCVFIKTTVPEPATLVSAIFQDSCVTAKSKSRYIMRLLPVLGTCRAKTDQIEQLSTKVLADQFGDGASHTYCIHYKCRNNSIIHQREVVAAINKGIADMNGSAKPDLKNPEFIISADIIKTICCLSLLKDYTKYKKYNLQEVTALGSVRTTPEQEGTIKTSDSENQVKKLHKEDTEMDADVEEEQVPEIQDDKLPGADKEMHVGVENQSDPNIRFDQLPDNDTNIEVENEKVTESPKLEKASNVLKHTTDNATLYAEPDRRCDKDAVTAEQSTNQDNNVNSSNIN